MTVAEFMARVSPAEFQEWQVFHRVEPLGPWRDDYRIGLLTATWANAKRSRNTDRFVPADFMFKYEPFVEKSIEEVADDVAVAMAGLGIQYVPPEVN